MLVRQLVIAATLFAAACTGATSDEGTWKLDRIEASGALMSVWGSSENDVWAAGGETGRGLVLHNDGRGWVAVETGATELLWWVYGFSADDVYAVGEGGLILHYDGVSWQRIESGTDKTLFGVWGASGGEVWIVGGDPFGDPGEAVVLRGTSESFAVAQELPTELLPNALYKIYGGPQGLVTVGSSGTVLRFDGDEWTRQETPTNQSIFSLWGRSENDVYAVGGSASGEVLHFDGNEWTKINDDGLRVGLSGVFTAPDQPIIAVGQYAYVLEIHPDGSQYEPQMPIRDTIPSLHGVWGDGTGTTYAVGGDLYGADGPRDGVIYRRD